MFNGLQMHHKKAESGIVGFEATSRRHFCFELDSIIFDPRYCFISSEHIAPRESCIQGVHFKCKQSHFTNLRLIFFKNVYQGKFVFSSVFIFYWLVFCHKLRVLHFAACELTCPNYKEIVEVHCI